MTGTLNGLSLIAIGTGPNRWRTLVPGPIVSEITRRHGLPPQQVFTWRRQARRWPTPMADDPPFVPAKVDALVPVVAGGHERKTARRKAKPDVEAIEIEAEGVTIRVGRGADVATIAAIVHAPKPSR